MASTDTINRVANLASQTINATAETAVAGAVVAAPPTIGLEAGRTFRLRFVGTAAGGTGATLTFKLYVGAAVTGTLLGTFTVSAAAIPATGGNFALAADLTWDAVSKLVNGFLSGHTNNTLASGAVTPATVAAASGLSFAVSATFGAALATNAVKVTEFCFEQI